jgi:hypothetical protein
MARKEMCERCRSLVPPGDGWDVYKGAGKHDCTPAVPHFEELLVAADAAENKIKGAFRRKR